MIEMNEKRGFFHTIFQFYQKHTLITLIVVLSAMALFVFGPFLFGSSNFVFFAPGIDGDSYLQTYPILKENARDLSQGILPSWNNGIGLGVNTYGSNFSVGEPLTTLLLLMGENAVLPLMNVYPAIKCVLAGMFFYLFLSKLLKNRDVAFITAILYAFCGHMVARSAWISYPNEVVWVAFCLYAFELFFKNKNKILLPISFAILFLSLKSYQTLVYSPWIAAYALIRYFLLRKEDRPKFVRYFFTVLLLYLIGLAISMVVVLPSFMYYMEAARTEATLAVAQQSGISSIFATNTEAFTAFFRMLNTDMVGLPNQYTGVDPRYYLQDPVYYCGILCVFLIPQAFTTMDKKHKILFGILFAFSAAYTLILPLRFMMNFFVTTYFKHTSFFIIITMLICSAMALIGILRKRKVNIKLLLITAAVLVVMSVWGWMAVPHFVIDRYALVSTAVFAALFILVFWLFQNKKINARRLIAFLLILCVIEVSVGAYRSQNLRMFISDEMMESGYGYDDGAKDVIAQIKADDEGVYRIDQIPYSANLNDSVMQGRYGFTQYYDVSQPLYDYISAMNIDIYSETPANLFPSYWNRPNIKALLGEKYLISDQSNIALAAYGDPIAEYDGLYVYQNKYSMPFGFSYNEYMTQQDFDLLPMLMKETVMQNAVVLSEQNDGLKEYKLPSYEEVPIQMSDISVSPDLEIVDGDISKSAIIKTTGNDPHIIIPCDLNGKTASVDYKILDNKMLERNSIGQIFWANDYEFSETNSFSFGVRTGGQNFSFVFENIGGNMLRIDPMSAEASFEFGDLQIATMDKNKYLSLLENASARANENAFQIETLSNTRIEGNITSGGNEILFVPVVYDKGWSVTINGIEQECLQVNYGFLGTRLAQGENHIVFEYEPPYMKKAGYISICGLVALGALIGFERYGKAKRKREKNG